MFLSSETGVSGNIWCRIKGAKYRFALQDGTWFFSCGRDWGQEEKGMTEDEMVGWHQQRNGHEFE